MLLLIGFSVVAAFDRFMMDAEEFFLLKELEAINHVIAEIGHFRFGCRKRCSNLEFVPIECSVRGARSDAPMKPTLSRLRCGFPLWVLTEILGCTHKIGRRVAVSEIVYLYPNFIRNVRIAVVDIGLDG